MGLFIRQDDNRSQLQERLAAELREKAKARASLGEPIDQTTNSNYLKNTEMTSQRVWVWLAVVAAAAFVLVGYIIAT